MLSKVERTKKLRAKRQMNQESPKVMKTTRGSMIFTMKGSLLFNLSISLVLYAALPNVTQLCDPVKMTQVHWMTSFEVQTRVP